VDSMSFRELRENVFRLHADGRYADALALIRRESERLGRSGQEGHLAFWEACLRTLLGETEEAIDCLSCAIEQGHWWSEAALRRDPDLASLQGNERFESLVAVCQRRHAEAQSRATPVLRVLEPTSRPPWPLLLALHSAGGNVEESAEHWGHAVDQGWLVALPQSSQVLWPNGYCWTDRDRAIRELVEHYHSLLECYSVDSDRVVLGGFSQGGAVAIWAALSGALKTCGVMGVACALRDLGEIRDSIEQRPMPDLRVYLVVGEKDGFCPRVGELSQIIRQARMSVRLEEVPGLGHDYPMDLNQYLVAGLSFLLGCQ
jgi:predicted esterase